MKIGYARISTLDQNLNLQKDALNQAGCEKVFEDVASGAKEDRSGLGEAIEYARAGDSIVVWRLDRLGRSLKHLIETVNRLSSREVGFVSLQESIDTTTAGGTLIFHIFGALAQFERQIIRDRTNAGLEAARARANRRQTAETQSETDKAGERFNRRQIKQHRVYSGYFENFKNNSLSLPRYAAAEMIKPNSNAARTRSNAHDVH